MSAASSRSTGLRGSPQDVGKVMVRLSVNRGLGHTRHLEPPEAELRSRSDVDLLSRRRQVVLFLPALHKAELMHQHRI